MRVSKTVRLSAKEPNHDSPPEANAARTERFDITAQGDRNAPLLYTVMDGNWGGYEVDLRNSTCECDSDEDLCKHLRSVARAVTLTDLPAPCGHMD